MELKSKTIQLKNGQICTLRSPRSSDAAAMNEFIKTISGETHYILRYPEECIETVEQEAAFLEGFLHSDTNLMISAFIGGKPIANSQISLNKRIKTKHRATLAIGIKKDYWNLGLGRILFTELLNYARQRDIVQAELEFIEGNNRAQALYEKMGFKVIAEKKRAIRLKDGTYLSEFLMVNELDK